MQADHVQTKSGTHAEPKPTKLAGRGALAALAGVLVVATLSVVAVAAAAGGDEREHPPELTHEEDEKAKSDPPDVPEYPDHDEVVSVGNGRGEVVEVEFGDLLDFANSEQEKRESAGSDDVVRVGLLADGSIGVTSVCTPTAIAELSDEMRAAVPSTEVFGEDVTVDEVMVCSRTEP